MQKLNTTGKIKICFLIVVLIGSAFSYMHRNPPISTLAAIGPFVFSFSVIFISTLRLKHFPQSCWNENPFKLRVANYHMTGWFFTCCGTGILIGNLIHQLKLGSVGIVSVSFGLGYLVALAYSSKVPRTPKKSRNSEFLKDH